MSQGGMGGGGMTDPGSAVASGVILAGSIASLPATSGNILLHAINFVAIVAFSAIVALFITSLVIKKLNK